eukprot:421460_1
MARLVKVPMKQYAFILILFSIIIMALFVSQHPLISYSSKKHSDYNEAKSSRNRSFPFYIFQIGLNKCEIYCRAKMISRYEKHEPVIQDYSDKYMFYSDFDPFENFSRGNSSVHKYKVLFDQYNDAKFILNIRNVNHWLGSKFFHFVAHHKGHGFFMVACKRVDGCYHKLIKLQNIWYEHNCNVIRYFKTVNVNGSKKKNLLIFDIDDTQSVFKMIEFFDGFGLHLNASFWTVTNSKHERYDKANNKTKMLLDRRVDLWNKIIMKYPQLTKFNTTLSDFLADDKCH